MTQKRGWLLLLSGLTVVVPFLFVQYPPITDLPQQLAQIRLFQEALSAPATPYEIHWWAPNRLCYGLLGAAWALAGPAAAGRLAVAAVAVLWAAALFHLARYHGRAPSAAVLATVFFFNHGTYWGFLSFALGWPAFVVWHTVVSSRPERFDWRQGLLVLASGLLLYETHVLWLVAALVWLGVLNVVERPPWRLTVARLASLLPLGVVVAVWYPSMVAAGFRSPPEWGVMPWERLSPAWLLNASLGGLQGLTEPVLFLVVLAWLALGLWQRRRGLGAAVDRRLLLAAVLFWTFALLLPDKHTNTIRFSSRWMPFAMTLTLLALPVPDLRPTLRRLAATGILAALSLSTAATWMAFEAAELKGFEECLEALPPAPRLIGLDFVRQSSLVKNEPYFQLFAYAQVFKGGTLHFSFADFANSLVVFKRPRSITWRPNLEWFPQLVRPRDFEAFDYALIHGGAEVQEVLSADPRLEQAAGQERWRLYRVAEAEDARHSAEGGAARVEGEGSGQ